MERANLTDFQLRAFARVNREIVRFFELLEITDGLVWDEYDLKGMPSTLVADVVPSYYYPDIAVDVSNLAFCETSVTNCDLFEQVRKRVWRTLSEERFALMNTPAYDGLARFLAEHVDAYPLNEEGEWILDPELRQPSGDDIFEPSLVDARIETAKKAHQELLAEFAPL